ncbi:Small heat shock protein Ibp [Buchnera aphidicola (Tetraneura ulmi)]|uniref:Hsp20 family protein n=1 Tax=Buchnera aphidicola TaxID=9 RepID=UPI003463CF32
MSYRSFSLIPGYNHNIFSERFDQIDKMFSTITGEKPISNIPTYNLYQNEKKIYQLEISVPGYQEEELNISVHNNQISVIGKQNTEKTEKQKKYIHQGIKNQNFSIKFNLHYKIKVKKAKIKLGILIIKFEYKIPEEEKPEKIKIENNDSKNKISKI